MKLTKNYWKADMSNIVVIRLSILFLFMFSGSPVSFADDATAYKFYYVAVGSDHYKSFDELKGMGISARVTAEYFERFGAEFGVTLRSKRNKYISKQDILKEIDRVQRQMQSESGKDIVLIFYYAGHCLGEPLTGQQWIFPGNIDAPRSKLDRMVINSDVFDDRLLSLITLNGSLGNSLATQTMVIMDCCYSAGDNVFPKISSYFTEKLGLRHLNFITDLRRVNLSDDPWNTNLYATLPGSRTYPVTPPKFMTDRIVYNIGPLARRLSLVLNKLEGTSHVMSYQAFVDSMQLSNLDPKTEVARSYNNDIYNDKPLFKYVKALSAVRLKQSYASGASSSTFPKSLQFVSPAHQAITASIAGGKSHITIKSEEGDWIGKGKNWLLKPDKYEIFAAQDFNRMTISAQDPKEIDHWIFEFILPKSYALPTQKAGEQSAENIYWSDKNVIEMSATGRGCDTNQGKYSIKLLERDSNDAIVRLIMGFQHNCEGDKAGLSGIMDLKLKPLL